MGKKVKEYLKDFGPVCERWDNGYPECSLPWCGKGERECKGQIFKCKKMYYHHLASAKKPFKHLDTEMPGQI